MEKRTMFLGVQVEQYTMLITALHLLHRLPHLQYSTIVLTIASSAKTNRRPTCRKRVSAARNGPWLNTDAPSRVLTTASGNKNVSVSWAVPRRDPLIPDPVAVVFRPMSVLEALDSTLLIIVCTYIQYICMNIPAIERPGWIEPKNAGRFTDNQI